VVPHINIRSPPLQPGKFVIDETKRLLQHYRHFSDMTTCLAKVRYANYKRTSVGGGAELQSHCCKSEKWVNIF
jgi:hypothetical protein